MKRDIALKYSYNKNVFEDEHDKSLFTNQETLSRISQVLKINYKQEKFRNAYLVQKRDEEEEYWILD